MFDIYEIPIPISAFYATSLCIINALITSKIIEKLRKSSERARSCKSIFKLARNSVLPFYSIFSIMISL